MFHYNVTGQDFTYVNRQIAYMIDLNNRIRWRRIGMFYSNAANALSIPQNKIFDNNVGDILFATATTNSPSKNPSVQSKNPTKNPSVQSKNPTNLPSKNPSNSPTDNPTFTTNNPTTNPTLEPTFETENPTINPTFIPSRNPTTNPTTNPT
eukprot:107707_1